MKKQIFIIILPSSSLPLKIYPIDGYICAGVQRCIQCFHYLVWNERRERRGKERKMVKCSLIGVNNHKNYCCFNLAFSNSIPWDKDLIKVVYLGREPRKHKWRAGKSEMGKEKEPKKCILVSGLLLGQLGLKLWEASRWLYRILLRFVP